MEPEQEKLVLDNLKLVHYVVRKYIKPPRHEYEDFVSVGTLGLVLAAQKYDPQLSQFSTFATHYILGYCKRYRRTLPIVKYPREVFSEESQQIFEYFSLDFSLPQDTSRDAELYNFLKNPQSLQELEEVELRVALESFIKKLSAQNTSKGVKAYIIYLQSCLKGIPKTQEEIAAEVQSAQAHVSRAIKKYNQELKTFLRTF